MREISTKKIEIGEHVLIDGVEYVAKEMKSANGIPCLQCDLDDSKRSCAGVSCGGAYLKEVKNPTETQDKNRFRDVCKRGKL